MKKCFALLLCLALLCTAALAEEADMVMFRPVDCGMQAQEEYDYPFMGMRFTLPQTLLDRLDSREVFAMPMEDYVDDSTLRYAGLRLSTTNEEQRTQEGLSVDFFAWEESLGRLGALGVYHRDAVAELDAITGCDIHTKLGERADGTYQYYLSISSAADANLAAEVQQASVIITDMAQVNLYTGQTAFSALRADNVKNLGQFATEDVFGNGYTQDFFQQYDITLVNIFATWCSPCVQEMPELEKLRQAYADGGVKLGVVAMVLDVKTAQGIDQGALQRAQMLHTASGAQFPFLIPDDGLLNGRLEGIEAVPESFFVDANGNLVGETYVGARNMQAWTEIVEAELAALGVSQ